MRGEVREAAAALGHGALLRRFIGSPLSCERPGEQPRRHPVAPHHVAEAFAFGGYVGFDGSEVFQGDVDLFAVLEDLQTALEDNDADGVSAVIDDLTDGHEQIVEWRAVVGHSYAVTEDAIDTAGNVEAMLQTELDGLVGIDETEVYLRLAELRTAYEAAMRVGGTSVSGTLFSYL